MALIKYFKHTDNKAHSILPDPQEPLSVIVPSSRIEAVNTIVKPVFEEQIDGNCSKMSSRGKYEIFSPDEKAKIGKRAVEHSNLAKIHYFSNICPDRALNKCTVRRWKNKYIRELLKLKKLDEEVASSKRTSRQKAQLPIITW